MPTVTERATELEQKRGELAAIFEQHRVAGENGDRTYDMPPAVLAEVRSRNEELNGLTDEWLAAREAEEISRKNEADRQRLKELERPNMWPEQGSQAGGLHHKGAERKTLGDLFVESAAFREHRGGRGPVAVLPDFDLKTLFQTSAGWDPEDMRTGRIAFDEQQPVPVVADIVPKTTTRMSTVLYVEETTYTNNAAEVAEGGTYGESAFALTERSSEVRKIGASVPVTDEQFEDEVRARDYITNRLTNQLRQRLDQQILTGNGTAPNLRGIANVSGINTQAKGTDPTPDAVLKAIVKCRTNGFAEPDFVVMHPNDWQDVRLLRTAEGQYIWGLPSEAGPARVWGKPVITTTYQTEGTAVTGDFGNHSELALRRGIELQVSNSHSTYFVEGKQSVRADFRCALIFYRPLAFCTITGI